MGEGRQQRARCVSDVAASNAGLGGCSVASFIIHDRMGASHYEVDDDAIDRVLGELDDPVDDRHPVSIEHVSGWVLSAFQSGLVVGRTSKRMVSHDT
jgi:hypothetical protein